MAIKRRAYAPWKKTFSDPYILLGIASQSSNSPAGKMPDDIKSWTVVVINCIRVYRLSAITCISWHCLIRQNRCLGALVLRNGERKRASFWRSSWLVGCSYASSSRLRMSCILMVEFQPMRWGSGDILNLLAMLSLSIL